MKHISYRKFITEQLKKIDGTQYGSNSGGVHVDDKGNKFYVKHYNNSDQAKVEALTGKIYSHMGINNINPEYKEINSKPSVVTKWNDNLKQIHPSEFERLDSKQANQIGRMYHGAILTKNWDIVGLEHDNILKDRQTGNLHSIDHGGAFHFRARGSSKDYGPDIDDHSSLRTVGRATGHVFNSVFSRHPQAELNGLEAVKNIDDNHVHSLFKNSSLDNWEDLHYNFMKRKQALLSRYK